MLTLLIIIIVIKCYLQAHKNVAGDIMLRTNRIYPDIADFFYCRLHTFKGLGFICTC